MKILMAVTYYEPHISGLTIYVERISEELVRRGHQVTVMTSAHIPGLPLREDVRGVSVVRLPVALRLNKGVIMPSLPKEAWRLVREHDVVHAHLPLAEAGYIAWVASRYPEKRTILTYHCEIQLPPSLLARPITMALTASHHLAARYADAIVTYTKDYAKHSRFTLAHAPKVLTVYPPVSVEPPDLDEVEKWRSELGLTGKHVVGFAGRFSADKGGNFLLDAVPKVIARLPDTTFVFSGEYKRVIGESFYDSVRPQIERERDHLLFLGELRGRQLSDFYRMCDVLTLPSVNSTESFGMVQVEAMICGTPVVASDIPGVREATRVSGMGMTVPPGDPEALAAALIEVIENRPRYTASNLDVADAFSVGRNVDFYERLYSSPGTK